MVTAQYNPSLTERYELTGTPNALSDSRTIALGEAVLDDYRRELVRRRTKESGGALRGGGF